MTTTLTRRRATGLIDHAKETEIPGWEVALDRLGRELVSAFFIAMAAMWVVTAIAGIFR
jgi:1,4-alpha-glucan branching enzyme